VKSNKKGDDQMFCLHKFKFVKNLYGYACKSNGYNRSMWECEKCGKRKGKSKSHHFSKNIGEKIC
jgi:hypothetical protein